MYPFILVLTVIIFYNRYHPYVSDRKRVHRAVQTIQLTRTKYTQTSESSELDNMSVSTCDMGIDYNFFKSV